MLMEVRRMKASSQSCVDADVEEEEPGRNERNMQAG